MTKLPPVLLAFALLVYFAATLPRGTEVVRGYDGSFGINIAGGGPVPHVLFHRAATLDISSIHQRRPTVRMSLGVRTDAARPQPVAIVAELPIHAEVSDVAVRQDGVPDRHYRPPADETGDLPTVDGILRVRESRDPGSEALSSLVLRIPVRAAPGGTTVEITGTVDAARFTAAGRPAGLHYVHLSFGHGHFVEVPNVWNLPAAPDYRGPNLILTVDIGAYRLRQSTAVPDPTRTRATVIAWSEPRAIAGIDVAMTAEDATRTSIMSWLGAVLFLLLGGWLGHTADRLRRRRVARRSLARGL